MITLDPADPVIATWLAKRRRAMPHAERLRRGAERKRAKRSLERKIALESLRRSAEARRAHHKGAA